MAQFFSVEVNRISKDADTAQDDRSASTEKHKLLDRHYNKIAAKVIQGRMVEYEHQRLAGPDVKFSTMIDYRNVMNDNDSISVVLRPQSSYVEEG